VIIFALITLYLVSYKEFQEFHKKIIFCVMFRF